MQTLPQGFSIGADIECFLQSKQTGKIVSAEGIVKGSKSIPFNFDPSDKWYATSLDNVMAEFCIPPSFNIEEFKKGIHRSTEYINTLDETLCSVFIPCTNMEQKYLETENAKLFGCERDLNCWTQEFNPKPVASGTLRTAG
jgi:hypothetical protein